MAGFAIKQGVPSNDVDDWRAQLAKLKSRPVLLHELSVLTTAYPG